MAIDFKKRIEEQYQRELANMSFEDRINLQYRKQKAAETAWKKEEEEEDDIAPVKKKEKERTWFDTGAFDDGYQIGDVTKTILGTTGEAASTLMEGVANMGHNLAAFTAGGVAEAADFLGKDEYADKIRNRLAGKDEETNEFLNKYSPVEKFKDAGDYFGKNSVTGEKTDNLIASVGTMAGAMAMGPLGLPAMGLQAAGGELQNAYAAGATPGEAWKSAAVTGISEMVIERLSGGISFGTKTLDELWKEPLTRAITNRTTSTLAKYGLDVLGEGAEEVITEAVQSLGRLSYEDKSVREALFSEEARDNYIEAFIGGGIIGGGFNAKRAYDSVKTGRDYDTGLSGHEQSVIDSEVGKRTTEKQKQAAVDERVNQIIAQREKKFGTTLSETKKRKIRQNVQNQLDNGKLDFTKSEIDKKERAEIEKQVREDFDRGFIDIDSIGDMFSPEKTAQIRELNAELSKTTDEAKTAEIRAKLDELTKSRLVELDSRLEKDVYLKESLKQEVLKGMEFTREVTDKDSEITKSLVESAKSVGMNNTRRMHDLFEYVDKIANHSNYKYEFTNTAELEENAEKLKIDERGTRSNGMVVEVDGEKKVLINVDSDRALNFIIGHETGHVVESAGEYAKLQKLAKEYAISKDDYEHRLKSISKLYEGMNANIDNEVTADLIGDYLFTDEQFIKELTTERNIFQKIYDYVKRAYKMATAGSQEKRQLEKVKRSFEKAYKEISKTTTQQTKDNLATDADSNTYSLSDSQGIELTKGQQEYFKDSKVRDENGNLLRMYHGTSNAGHTVFDPWGKAKYGLFGTGSYFTDDPEVAISYTEKGKGNNPDVYEVYLNITNPIDMDAPGSYEAWSKALPDADFPLAGTNEDFYRAMEEYFEDDGFTKWEAAETARDVIESMGYDGITHIGGGRFNKADETRHRVYIAFQSEQIKNFNNENPTDHPDIRYSLSSDSSVSKYSLTSWNNTDKASVLTNLTNAGYKKTDAEKWINDVNSVAAVIARSENLDYDPDEGQTMLKNNQEYVKTLDASTLCKKRLLYQGTYNAIQHRLPNTALMPEDVLRIREMMAENGLEVPCGICYEESRKKNEGKFAKKWLSEYAGDYKPTLEEVTTTDGRERLKAEHPEVLEDYLKFQKTRGSANPKVTLTRTDYQGEILGLSQSDIEKIKHIGGLRVQSFSDFETPHLIDMMQAVLDMAEMKLTSQAYTKVPNFARVFGETGIKINLSLIGQVDKNGKLVFDGKEGINPEEAFEIRNQHSKHVGTILVGANKESILAGWADDRIDMVIPFHRSGWKLSELETLGLTGYRDFTRYQSERYMDGSKNGLALSKVKKNHGFEMDELYSIDYWDYSKTGKENAEEYLRLCAEQKRRPVFYNFLVDNGDGSYSLQPDGSTDGYWKSLVDFKMYDNDGVGSPQELVRPNFNMNEAHRVLEEYDENPNELPVADEIVEQFVSEYKGNHPRGKYSLSGDAAPMGSYNVYRSDVLMPEAQTAPETPTEAPIEAPVEEIAPVVIPEELRYEEGRPLTEEDLPNFEKERSWSFDSITEADAPEEIAPIAPEYKPEIEPVSPLEAEGRDMKEVGKRNVKAYMYENPEVRPFFQREAQYMLNDLRNSVKGEKHYNDELYYISGGEQGFYGTKRQTSDEIAYLLDNFKYTYADIEKGLKAIIEDHGAENNAISKRIEFMLDERLREGYTDAMYGDTMPPDQEYLDLLREKQITEYSDEAYEAWLKTIDFNEFAPMEGVQKQYNPDTGAFEGDVQAEAKAALAKARTENKLLGRESNFDSHDFTVSRGVQQEYDLETEEIVDDTHDIELERLEKRKQKAMDDLGDLTSFTKKQAQTLYDEVRMMQKGKKVSGDLGFILDRMFEGVDKKAPNYEEVKDATYKKITDALLAIERSPAKPEKTVPPTEALIRNSIETKYGWRVSEIEGMKLDSRAEARRKLRKELLGGDAEFLVKALDNAKNRGRLLLNNTDTIRANELVLGREAANKINKIIFQKAIDNESKSISWQNKERSEIKELGIKAKDKLGRVTKESAAVQKYGEKQYVNEFGDLVKYGDDELAAEFPDVETQAKIRKAARVIREKYDAYIDIANETLTKLGFDPIKKRSDYMRHFQELNDVFSNFGIPFNAETMQEHSLPTDINGLTEFWSPQKNYFASVQPREGIRTTYDAITGIDEYISGIANLIYHTEDIQRGRAYEELIRETYGKENGPELLKDLSPEEQKARAEKISKNHLSKYAAWVHEWTNNMAGKKNKLDRAIEDAFDRAGFSVLDTIRKQVGTNMIGFNLSSSLTNLISPIQAMAKTNKLAVAKGTADTVKNIFVKDDFMEKNSFLTARMGTDMLSKTPWQKVQDAGYIFMKGMDWFSSNQIVRSKYYELLSKGMTEEQAHAEAGKFAARIMGDRTKGAQPHFYNSKLFNIVGQFQLEVNNQLYSMFYDTYHESKENAKNDALRTAAGITFTLGQLAAYTHVFGKTFEAIAGYNPTFDIIGIIATAFGAGDDEEEKTWTERLEAAGQKLAKALPYSSVIFEGGRIPIASALPFEEFWSGKDDYGNEKSRWETVGEALPYYLLPAGYGQLKKTSQGLQMFDEDLPVTGSYTDSGNLRFPVEDTMLNRAQAAIFGQWSSANARNYFDNERQPLKEKQIQEFAELDIPIADYWEYREGLKDKETVEEKFDYIAGLDLPVSKKNIMINNVVDRDEKVDLINYDDFGSYEEFDFAANNRKKYDWLQANNVQYKEYNKNDVSREAYNWAYENQEGYTVSRAVSDVVTYRQITGSLNDIKADKDKNGKSISGSRKEKVASYINGLDLDYGAKLILFKTEYPSEDRYNTEIIDYLNNRQDISEEDMRTILTKLKFTVDAEGNIYW